MAVAGPQLPVADLPVLVDGGHERLTGQGCGTDHATRDTTVAAVAAAQEEGDVFMLEPPFPGFFAGRCLMDFYATAARDICSRMHLHTGLRFVRMMTGPDTAIRVSGLSPITVRPPAGRFASLSCFADELPGAPDGVRRERHNVVVPPHSWVDMQIARGVSHQFNAAGPNAVIDSVHPQESIETLWEGMSGYRMMAQTIFLAKDRSPAATCADTGAPRTSPPR
ncbi:hypothetical protein AB0L49_50380 [Streptomyces antimycoticus]|uniref:hypothetical protein n=1 Tax=Streptomyces antimycoticus TaxID=68175 RepID=UPI00343C7EF0